MYRLDRPEYAFLHTILTLDEFSLAVVDFDPKSHFNTFPLSLSSV